MSKQVLVIMFPGAILPKEDLIAELASRIATDTVCAVQDITVKHIDEKSLANIIVKSVISQDKAEDGFAKPTLRDHIENAAGFIKIKYGEHMVDVIDLAFKLQKDVSDIRARKALNPAFVPDEDEALLDAVKILATDEAEKYSHLPVPILNAIRYVNSRV
jgi:hypothetical protein